MKKNKYKLTKEEQALLDSFERDEWHSVKNVNVEIKKTKKIAENTMKHWKKEKKDARINIRLTAQDLEKIKKIAEHEGLPYQTLISSILHQFSLGHLKKVA